MAAKVVVVVLVVAAVVVAVVPLVVVTAAERLRDLAQENRVSKDCNTTVPRRDYRRHPVRMRKRTTPHFPSKTRVKSSYTIVAQPFQFSQDDVK